MTAAKAATSGPAVSAAIVVAVDETVVETGRSCFGNRLTAADIRSEDNSAANRPVEDTTGGNRLVVGTLADDIPAENKLEKSMVNENSCGLNRVKLRKNHQNFRGNQPQQLQLTWRKIH